MGKSYIFFAPGFEEIEALTTLDILRRGGLDVETVAITDGGKEVEGAHGVNVEADLLPAQADIDSAEWLICPGGMPGAKNLAESTFVTQSLLKHNAAGGRIAAICASPALVLTPLGILDGKDATCYPGMEPKDSKVNMTGQPVVVLDRIITGNGPANTFRFALAILKKTIGEEGASQVASGLLFKD